MPQDSKTNKKRSIVAYDYLQVHGGAEIVTKEILKGLEFDELYTAFANNNVIDSLGLDKDKIKTGFNPTSNSPVSMLKALWHFAFNCPREEYNTVIVSGIFAPLLARKIKAKYIIYYCHTPPRFLYDLKTHYKETLSKPAWLLLKLFSTIYKPIYESSFNHIDKVFANSNNVKKRLKNYLNVESEILYPPCNTTYEGKESKGYFLSTARIEPLKRVDLIVEAFMEMPDKELVVMSGGSQLKALQEKAKNHPNITFTGWVTESQKRELINHCEATIYIPKDEDFGMAPVESISAGKPVIGVSEGGLLETVNSAELGVLIKPEVLSKTTIQGACKKDYKKNVNFGPSKSVPKWTKKHFILNMKRFLVL